MSNIIDQKMCFFLLHHEIMIAHNLEFYES